MRRSTTTGHSSRAGAIHAAMGLRLFCVLLALAALAACLGPTTAGALPDNRVYELVTPPEMNAASPGAAVPSANGETLDFQANAFGPAVTGAETLYHAKRSPSGWQTEALTPKGVVQAEFFAETMLMFISRDLSNSIFLTPQPFAAGDEDGVGLDLYERSQDGALDWVSQGGQGGSSSDPGTYAAATPDGSHVVFETQESLVAQATGLQESQYATSSYLYERNLTSGQTSLVDVDEGGQLINPEGAVLG